MMSANTKNPNGKGGGSMMKGKNSFMNPNAKGSNSMGMKSGMMNGACDKSGKGSMKK